MVGYVLQMLRDPLRGLEAVRRVCRGSVIVLDTVSAPLSLLPSPVARLCARRGHLEWFVFNRAGLAQALRLSGFAVEARTRILRDRAGPGSRRRPPPCACAMRRGCSAARRPSVAARCIPGAVEWRQGPGAPEARTRRGWRGR